MCTNPKFYLGCSCEGCLNYGKIKLLSWKGNGWASWGKQIGWSTFHSRYCTAWDIPRLDVPDSLSRFLCLWWFQSQGECDWFADPLGASMLEPQMTGCNFRKLPRIHSSSLTALASKFSFSSPVSAFRFSLPLIPLLPAYTLFMDASFWTCSVHSSLFWGKGCALKAAWCSSGASPEVSSPAAALCTTVTRFGFTAVLLPWRPVVDLRDDGDPRLTCKPRSFGCCHPLAY